MRTVNEINTEAKRETVIAAAIRCLARRGVAKTSIGDICKEAGMRSGHLYYYFESKDALLVSILQYQQTLALDLIEHMLEGPGDIASRIFDVHVKAEERRMSLGVTPIMRMELECYISRLGGQTLAEADTMAQLLDATRGAALQGTRDGRLPLDLDIDAFVNAIALIWQGLTHSRLSPDFDLEENRCAVRLLMKPWLERETARPA